MLYEYNAGLGMEFTLEQMDKAIATLDEILSIYPYKVQGIPIFSTLLQTDFSLRFIESFLNQVPF